MTSRSRMQKLKKFSKRAKARCGQIFRIFLKLLLSQAGTLLMVILYMIMGGYLFNYIEAENEIVSCNVLYSNYFLKLNESVSRITAIALSGVAEKQIRTLVMSVASEFATNVYKLNFRPSKNCSSIGEPGNWPEWNIVNAIYFSATVITTIGYGHITPKTMWGRIICMVYATMGIPIMLLFLTNIGNLMANIFRLLYFNLCCCRCFIKNKRIGSVDISPNGDESIPNFQLAHMSIQQNRVDDEIPGSTRIPINVDNTILVLPPPKIVIHDCSDEEEGDDYEESLDNVVIPISVTLLFLTFYISIGAFLFRNWETDWGLVDGTYFSFTTFATIGFGDLVPGKDGFEKAETGVEMSIAGIYCLIGLAILSMCINLIQDQLTAKFEWFSKRFQIFSDTEPDDDDDADDNADEDLEEEEKVDIDKEENFEEEKEGKVDIDKEENFEEEEEKEEKVEMGRERNFEEEKDEKENVEIEEIYEWKKVSSEGSSELVITPIEENISVSESFAQSSC